LRTRKPLRWLLMEDDIESSRLALHAALFTKGGNPMTHHPFLDLLEDRTLLSFMAPVSYDAGGGLGLAVADFNRDGNLDLATLRSPPSDPGSVQILMGNGDGSFRAPVSLPVGLRPKGLAVADLNGDGFPDIVVVNGGPIGMPGSVSVFLGNGDGTFQTRVDYPVGIDPSAVMIADLYGHKIFDIATTNRPNFFEPGSISILRGVGNGTFEAATSFPASTAMGGLIAADMTGSGFNDLVTFNHPTLPTGSVSVFLNRGDGTFRPPIDITVDSIIESVAVADLNGDRIPDLAVAIQGAFGSDKLSLFLGNGDGTFRRGEEYPIPYPPSFVTISDVTGDKIPDLIVAYSAGAVSVFPGKGDGTFGMPTFYVTGSGPTAVAVADVTGDGIPDLVTANQYGETVTVLVGNGDGSFTTYPSFNTGVQPTTALAMADLNGDGIPDLVTIPNDVTGSMALVSVLLGKEDGTYSEPALFPTGRGVRALAVGDVTGHRVPDIVTVNAPTFDTGSVSILVGNGDGTFRSPITFPLSRAPDAVALVDLRRNGILDLVIAATGSYPAYEGVVTVLLGNGDGTFGAPTDFPVGSHPIALSVADINGDGNLDLVTANNPYQGLSSVSVLLGNGNGTFRPAINTLTGRYPRSLAVGDFNGDGVADLAVADGSLQIPGFVNVLFGNGDGTFRTGPSLPVGANPSYVLAGHVNNGQTPDLIVTGQSGTRVLFGNGDGTFQPSSISYGSAGWALVARDDTAAGRPDLLVTQPSLKSIGLLVNDGMWQPAHRMRADVTPASAALRLAPPETDQRAGTRLSTSDPGLTRADPVVLAPRRVEEFFKTALAFEPKLLPIARMKSSATARDEWTSAIQGSSSALENIAVNGT
jgi:hypothetical protein